MLPAVVDRWSIPDVWLDTGRRQAATILRRLVRVAAALNTHAPKDVSRRLNHPAFCFEARDRRFRLVGAAYSYNSQPRVLFFELRGKSVDPPFHPEAYFGRVKRYFAPLLTDSEFAGLQWGLQYGGRRALPSDTAALLFRFADASRRANSVKIDWELFYDFVMHCHVRRVNLKVHDLPHFLAEAGIAGTQATELVSAYKHGRELLGKRCWHRPSI